MRMLRAHWMTGLTVVTAGFMAVLGVAWLSGAGEGDRSEFVAYGIGCLVGAAALAVGVWGLWAGRLGRRGAQSLVVAGLVGAGALLWWMMFPAVVALMLLYAGVIRGGLGRELAATRDCRRGATV